jgi:glycosyltransferase involved in cell wall biosynthesis
MPDKPKIKVAFCYNFVTPYRLSFLSKMDKLPEIELLVVHGEVKKETGRPAASIGADWDFNHKVVQNQEKHLGPFVIRWQSGLLTVLRGFQPDVIVVLGISGTISNWTALLWGKIKRRRTLMWMCGWEAQERSTLAYSLKRFLLKFFIQLPTTLMVYSTKAGDYMVELGAPSEKCVVNYNGIDIEESRRKEADIMEQASELRSRLNPDNKPVFLYVGGILPKKRVDLLLRAFAKANQKSSAVLWIVGDGPVMEEVRDIAHSLDVSGVSFLGRIIDDVDPYFVAADFFVLPGIGGLALNQAMFWGTPCICSEADGTEEDLVIDNETGFRFEVGSEESLTQTMQRALDLLILAEAYSEMQNKGRKLIENRSNSDEILKTFAKEFNKGRV